MSTTNVESNNKENESKGPVVIEFSTDQQLELVGKAFTSDMLEEVGVQNIGAAYSSHNIIDDRGRGFRIIQSGKKLEVKELPSYIVKLITEQRQKDTKETGLEVPIKQSDIDLIKKQTNYDLVIEDKSMILDDTNARNVKRSSKDMGDR